MNKKNKPSLAEFSTFETEQEKRLGKLIIIGDAFFLFTSFIIMFLSEEVFHAGILSWRHYGILVIADVIINAYFALSIIKNFKIWLLKYVLAIFLPLILITWAYFTDPKHVTAVLFSMFGASLFMGVLFFDFKPFFLYIFISLIFLGILFFHYSRIGIPIPLYDLAVIISSLFIVSAPSFVFTQRVKIFLTELLEKRKELEETKSALEIKVKARTQELEELTEGLEGQVKERTKELQKRIEELEKIHQLTVGRELKMVDLKREIDKLGKELEEKNKEIERLRG